MLAFDMQPPSWSAIMHKVMDCDYPGKPSVVFLPMINMNPSDLTCINSTANFIGKRVKAQHCVPIFAFDQPLYWKAMNIIKNEPLNSPLKLVILRLRGFHLEMNFVGGIGHLMEGSRITELHKTVYAPSAVTHITSGKVIAREVRAHFLIYTALMSIILSYIYGIPLPDEIENETGTNDINPANCINTENTDMNAEDLLDELHGADY
ncbi:unnamed protein product [Mytilus edulis]|uniref:Uncharacterized protein n=1 Tax=Mytilus edulis TaxID=6550 RepID=A0A8S3U849_MYTED|nr:unnamed protein product [Mytilus edulis]